MIATLTHLQLDVGYSKCGKHLRPEQMTQSKAAVTCRSCNRDPNNFSINQAAAQKAARLNPNHGDDNFPGLGILTCRNCNRPYNIHPLAVACPFGPDR